MNGKTLLPKKFSRASPSRKKQRKSVRPRSANNGNMSALSTDQVFDKMKSRRTLRRKSMIPTETPIKKSTSKFTEGQMRTALDYNSYKTEPVDVVNNSVSVSAEAVDAQNFNAPEVHEKAMKNRLLARVI